MCVRYESSVTLVGMQGIGKAFSGVPVLRGVDFDVAAGEVHVLAGENGAGKSTLIKILCGVHTDYTGQVHLRGRAVRFRSCADAARQGISAIHQEMSLVPSLSVTDNIFLGCERARGGLWMNARSQREAARGLLGEMGLDISLDAPAERYPVSVRQMIEISKALARRARILIMDEPTSALSQPEVERLFEIVRRLKRDGCGIVFISHKLEEIYRIADRITVLRDGERVGTARRTELSSAEMIRWMVGRDLKQQFPARPARWENRPVRLAVEGFTLRESSGTRRGVVEDVSLRVRAGEILGIAGLEGAGNHELLRGLFGAGGRRTAGRMFVDGKPFEPGSARAAIRRGVAFLTNDRQGNGLVPGLSVTFNTTLASIPACSRWGWMAPAVERAAAARWQRELGIRCRSADQPVRELSGGNQQKVLMGKWLQTAPRVLLLDEPTRGVDVGAKQDIYALMNRWSEEGLAMLLITSELPELLAMSDRLLVMHRGRVEAEFGRGEATAENVLHAAMGGGGRVSVLL